MPIIQEGSVNTSNLRVPDVYVQILDPSVARLNGVPTNILGIVGVAEWGPVDAPTTISSMANFNRLFGDSLVENFDLGTAVSLAVLQGANDMRCVRVTDGTDINASASILDTVPAEGMLVAAKYSGDVGNSLTVTIAAGSNSTVATPTYKVIIARPNYTPEIFDNIGGTGLEVWQNMVNAINEGQTSIRSKSELVVATVGISVVAPDLKVYTLTGGTNGNSGVVATTLIGSDTHPRKGMYALRGVSCSVALLQGVTETGTWSNQLAFGLSEGIYMLVVGASGQYADIDSAILNKKDAGIDSYAIKVLLGDWVYYNDIINNRTRLVSPQAVIGGILVNSIPAQSSLNKELFGIIGTEATEANVKYSEAELEKLVDAGIDVITNPVPGGNYFAARIGHNASSNSVIWGDNYTRMTNYLAATLNSGMGIFVGNLITENTWEKAAGMISAFLQALSDATPPLIGDPTGNVPYSVQIDASNNPPNIVAKGMMIANVKVKYLAIVEVFLINLEGSQSTVIRTSTQPV